MIASMCDPPLPEQNPNDKYDGKRGPKGEVGSIGPYLCDYGVPDEHDNECHNGQHDEPDDECNDDDQKDGTDCDLRPIRPRPR